MPQENIQPDRSERVFYDKADYPVYIRKGVLSSYPNYTATSHWHDDLELILILSGNMQYNINGEIVRLQEGEGIFVNARQLHFGYSEDKSECIFLCILLHPVLLCASPVVEQRYVRPLLFNEHIPFCLLTRATPWERQILDAIQHIYDIRDDALSELKIQHAFLEIWIALCENAVSMQKEQRAGNHHLSALKDMIAFMDRSYSEKVSLEAIAAAGKVGKTGCCAIFKRYMNKTPNGYLTELRLRKAIDLMQHTDMTLLEISDAVGFSGASYFAETFRKCYATTPSEYRRALQQKPQ